MSQVWELVASFSNIEETQVSKNARSTGCLFCIDFIHALRNLGGRFGAASRTGIGDAVRLGLVDSNFVATASTVVVGGEGFIGS